MMKRAAVLGVLLASAVSTSAPSSEQFTTLPSVNGTGNSSRAIFQYFATFADPVRVVGKVDAGGIVWNCSGTECVTSGPWPVPGVASCNALAMQEGNATSYGYKGAQLSPDQLAECNKGVAAGAPPPTFGSSRGALNIRRTTLGAPSDRNKFEDGPRKSVSTVATPSSGEIRTRDLELTGTGSLSVGPTFAQLNVTTSQLILTGTGSLSVGSAFTPLNITTSQLTLTGATSH